MPYLNRFSGTVKGNICICGNSMGYSKLLNANKKGTVGSIGAFASKNFTEFVNDYPKKTTLNYKNNTSYSVLSFPPKSRIVYAEIFWAGLCKTNTKDITSLLSDPILFNRPDTSFKVWPTSDVKFQFDYTKNDKTCQYYIRSYQDPGIILVPDDAPGAQYYMNEIPGIMTADDEETLKTNHLGWGIVAVFENENEIYRNINIWLGAEIVGPEAEKSMLFEAKNVITAVDGKTKSNVFVIAGAGNADIVGDKLQIGKDENNLVDLSGPNNPANNFFASQVNDETGNISNRALPNHDAFNAQNVEAGVQGWDTTVVHKEIETTPEQTELYLNFKTNGDLYIPYCIGLSIDLDEHPDISVIKQTYQSYAIKGETITYSFVIKNEGNKKTSSFIFKDELDSGLSFIQGSLLVNGVITTYDPTIGFDLGVIDPNEEINISFDVIVN